MSAGSGEGPATVVELLRGHAAARPERTALVGFDGGERKAWTYAELDADTDRVAVGLLGLGLAPGDRVALCLDNSAGAAFYRLLHGAYKASLVPVPINTRLAPPEVAHIVLDAGARLLIAPLASHEALGQVNLGDAVLHGPELVDELEAGDGEVPSGPKPGDFADLLYTSGTTGQPKGARFAHRALGAFARQLSATLRLDGDDVLQTPAPVYTSTGTHTLPLPVLAVGGTFVIEPRFDVEASARRLRDEESTVYFAVPAMWILLLDQLPAAMELPRLRSLMYGGSVMPEPVIRRLLDRFPGAGLWNLYGLTEAGPNGTVLPPEMALTHPGSVGLPLDGTRIRILDADGREVEPGQEGEIAINAPSLMECYHGMTEATAATLVDGWLLTGDVGCFDADGLLYILDRKKDMIVRGGFNVYPAEVEAALLDHPDVGEVAVVGVEHQVLGEDIFAVLVPQPGATLDQEELEGLCGERLADFKRPRHWRFVEALPRNAMGKLLKRELRDQLRAERVESGS